MSKRATLLLAVFILTVASLLAALNQFKPQRQSITLHDGTVFELLEVTTAGKHSIRTGTNWNKIFGWLPQPIRGYFPEGTNEYHSSSASPIGIWVSYFRPPLQSRVWLLSGANGIEVPADTEEFHRNVAFIGFPAFPLNSKELTIAAAGEEKGPVKTYRRSAEFHIAVPSDVTVGAIHLPLPIPQTQTNKELEVTLTSLRIVPITKSPIYGSGLAWPESEATFKVMRSGLPDNRWQPAHVTIADPTGSPRHPAYRGAGRDRHCKLSSFPYPFPTNPWHLKVTFAKTTGFDPDEFVTFENIRIAETSGDITIGETKMLASCNIELVKVHTSDLLPDKTRAIELFLRLHPSPITFKLIECADTSGRKFLQPGTSRTGDNDFGFTVTRIPNDVKLVSATFAIPRTHTFDFFARPELVDSLKP